MSSDQCKGVLVNHHMVYKLDKRGLPASKLLTEPSEPPRGGNFDDVINRGEDKVPSQQKITGPPPRQTTWNPLPRLLRVTTRQWREKDGGRWR